MNMKKLIAALLLMVMLLSAVSALAASFKAGQYVFFTGSAYGYKSHNARHKTKTIVSKGSWSVAVDDQNGKWVEVFLPIADSLWFNEKYVSQVIVGTPLAAIIDAWKEDTGLDYCIRFGSGGYGRSFMLPQTAEYYKTYHSKVKADGKCNIRGAAGLDSKTYGTLKKGKTLKYLGIRCRDSRGIWWYSVEYKGKDRWVSSLYTHLTD